MGKSGLAFFECPLGEEPEMRRVLVATLATLTVVIGLSAALIGTASAATPVLTAGPGSAECTAAGGAVTSATTAWNAAKTTLSNIAESNTTAYAAQQKIVDDAKTILDAKLKLQSDACTTVTPTTSPTTPPPSGGKTCREYNREGVYDIPTSDSRYRIELDRDRDGLACERNESSNGGNYGSCNDYARDNLRDFRRGDVRYRSDWDRNNDGVACGNGDIIVSNSGDCVTFLSQNRDYGTRYNSLYNERIIRARSINSDGGTRVTNAEQDAIDRASDLTDYRNRWTSTRDSLRTICNDPTPPVQIITVPAQAPVTVTQAPPPPPAVGGSSSGSGSIPSGSVNTGGSTVAFTLAHNRAV